MEPDDTTDQTDESVGFPLPPKKPPVSTGAPVAKTGPDNAAAGYDVNAWNALPPEQQAKYTAQGGAPTPTPAPDANGQRTTASGISYAPTDTTEFKWTEFANKVLGQQGQVGVAGGNAQANAGAASARNNLGATVDQYNKEFGATARAVGEDKIDFGDGRGPVDVIQGDAANSKWWFGSPQNSDGSSASPAPAPAPAPTAAPAPAPALTPTPAPAPAAAPGFVAGARPPVGPAPPTSAAPEQATAATLGNWTGTTPGQGTDLYNALMKRAGQSLNVDSNDPIIRNQADAHTAQLERAKTAYLQGVAEKGGANANISSEARAAAEKVGTGSADFESELMGKELDARRQEIQHALDTSAGVLSAEQQQGLQAQLAQLQETGTTGRFNTGARQQESQFGRQMGQQGYQFGANLGARNYEFDTGTGQRESEFARTLAQRESEVGRQLTQTEKALLQRQYEFNANLGEQKDEFGRSLGQRAYEYDLSDQYRNSPLNG